MSTPSLRTRIRNVSLLLVVLVIELLAGYRPD